jgi:hypothetical protein
MVGNTQMSTFWDSISSKQLDGVLEGEVAALNAIEKARAKAAPVTAQKVKRPRPVVQAPPAGPVIPIAMAPAPKAEQVQRPSLYRRVKRAMVKGSLLMLAGAALAVLVPRWLSARVGNDPVTVNMPSAVVTPTVAAPAPVATVEPAPTVAATPTVAPSSVRTKMTPIEPNVAAAPTPMPPAAATPVDVYKGMKKVVKPPVMAQAVRDKIRLRYADKGTLKTSGPDSEIHEIVVRVLAQDNARREVIQAMHDIPYGVGMWAEEFSCNANGAEVHFEVDSEHADWVLPLAVQLIQRIEHRNNTVFGESPCGAYITYAGPKRVDPMPAQVWRP